MNGLFIVVAAILLCNIFDGLHKGFIKKSVSVVSIAVTLVLVTWVTPYISTFLQENTPLYHSVQEKCMEVFTDEEYNENVKTDQVLAIEGMNLPENMKSLLLENNNNEAYDLLQVGGFYEYIGAYLARLIINAIAYLCTFIMISVFIRMVLLALDIVTMLPVLHGINKLAGGVLGLAEGVILVWLGFLVVTIFCNGDVGRQIFQMIAENEFLLFLYNNNIILKLVIGLVMA